MRTARLLARKDLRTLVRSRPLLVALVGYPVLIAVLLLVLIYDTNRTTQIAFVNEDTTGNAITIGSKTYGVAEYKHDAEQGGAKILDMSRADAMHALDEGQVGGVLVIPDGFFASLRTDVTNAHIDLYTGNNDLGEEVVDRIRSSVFGLDLDISNAFIDQNTSYLQALENGGSVSVGGEDINLFGLAPTVDALKTVETLPSRPQDAQTLARVGQFASYAKIGINLANSALKVTNAPIRLDSHETTGKSPRLTSKAMSYALAIAIAFICTVLVAASLAAERDERVIGRLLHGICSRASLLGSKLFVGVGLAVAVSAGLFVAFAILAPQAWTRLPLLLVGVIFAGLAFSSLGMLLAVFMRDARTATLSAILFILPLIPLALLHATTGVLHTISECLPLQPSQELFNSLLFDHHWAAPLGDRIAQLAAIALVASVLSHRFVRRLV